MKVDKKKLKIHNIFCWSNEPYLEIMKKGKNISLRDSVFFGKKPKWYQIKDWWRAFSLWVKL